MSRATACWWRCWRANESHLTPLSGVTSGRPSPVSYRLLGNSHDAMEVTQDAFVKAFGSLATLQKPEAFGGWLMRIVSNLSLNYRRSRKTRRLPLDDLLGPSDASVHQAAASTGGGSDWMTQSGDPLHLLESEELGRKLKTALQQLPEKQRLAIIMFTMEEMPQKQVAEALQCSVEAVKWHVFRGAEAEGTVEGRDVNGLMQGLEVTRDELEFAISQYLDGSLAEAEVSAAR